MTAPICPKHQRPLVMFCPACRASSTSPKKAKAARRNGQRGGRPKGS